MTSFDVFAIVHELKDLETARLENIYQIESLFLFVFRKIGQGKQVLVVEPEVRVHLTRFERLKPKVPPNFCMAMRRHLRGAKVVQVFQHNFDRIIGIKLERGEESLTLIVELFKRGSLIVVRNDGTILMSLYYKKMRDRNILPGKPFHYPPLVGSTIFSLTREELEKLLKKSESDVVRTLARAVNLGGLYAEEIVQRSGIAKDQPANMLEEVEVAKLWNVLTIISSRIRASPPDLDPTLVLNETQPIDATPFLLQRYTNSDASVKLQSRTTMNEALDDFFIEQEKEMIAKTRKPEKKEVDTQSDVKQRSKEEIRLEHQLKQQENLLKEFSEQSEQANRIGSHILANLPIIEEITSTILNARKNGFSWDEISKKIHEGQEKGIESAKKIHKLEPDQSLVIVEIEEMLIELDFTKKVTAIAQEYFTYARKQKNKINGAMEAIEKTKKRLERAKQDFAEELREQEISESTIVERRKREWYEKFRWFWSSDGFLIIAGRDARSNEALVRRYMKKGDIFVHATVHGAPHTIILAEGKEVPESTIQEAGQLAASFSSAWKAGIGATDVYYVDPEQVSFTPQSGEYLVRGGVIVRGKRNFLKGTTLETAVGVIIEEKYARAIGGPLSAIKAKTDDLIILKPGDETRGNVAKQIRTILASNVPEQEKRKVLLLDLNEFVQFIPGSSKIQNARNET